MNIVPKNARTYVLNDFSTVKKAMFIVVENSKKDEEAEFLPVQINPDSIEYSYAMNSSMLADCANNENIAQTNGAKGGDFSVHLDFDIYDEYMARSNNDTIYTDFSLVNRNMDNSSKSATVLDRLAYFVRQGKAHKAAFRWGDVNVCGTIKEVAGMYKCFSRWGNVLKAEAYVRMQIGNANTLGLKEFSALALDKTSNAFMQAMLIADSALR